jgi:hypothetical protein
MGDTSFQLKIAGQEVDAMLHAPRFGQVILWVVERTQLGRVEPKMPCIRTYLVDSPHAPLRDTSFAARGIEDTSNGINYRDAASGLKIHLANDQMGMTAQRRAAAGLQLYLADARGNSGGDLAAAEEGVRLYLAASPKQPQGQDMAALRAAMSSYEEDSL